MRGVVRELRRYPVKSLLGELLDEGQLGARGLAGDRAFAFIDQATGKPVKYSLEMGSVARSTYDGWKKDTVRPGDPITATMHPLKDGSRGGMYLSVELPSGQKFGRHSDAAVLVHNSAKRLKAQDLSGFDGDFRLIERNHAIISDRAAHQAEHGKSALGIMQHR